MIFAPVEEVRLYRNSAIVRRKAVLDLMAGANEVILSGLSDTADPDSLRLFFSADVVGTDVQILPMTELAGPLPSKELEQELRELQRQTEVLQATEKLWFDNANLQQRGDWTREMIEAYLENLPARVGALQKQQQELAQRAEALKQRLNEQKKKEAFRAVRLVLACPAACQSVVELEYAERSARWLAAYEIHSSGESQELSVVSRARMIQATSEDWENVRVSLYTGNPSASQSIPVLNKLNLRFKPEMRQRPSVPAMAMAGARLGAASPKMAPQEAEEAEPPKQMVMEEAVAADAETMTGYILPGRRTILSGTVGTMADLKTDVIPAVKSIVCVPRLDNSAYLAAVVRTADWPLKPAEAKIYLNQNYCGSVYAAPDPAEEEFVLSLGRDERVAVRREVIRSKTESVLLKGQKRIVYEFSVCVSNLSDQPRKVTVWDQIPVSTEKQIVVDKVDTDGAVLDEESGKLRWNLTLEAKSTVEKRLSYVVSYPKDKELQEVQTMPAPSVRNRAATQGRDSLGRVFCKECGTLSDGQFCKCCGAVLPR